MLPFDFLGPKPAQRKKKKKKKGKTEKSCVSKVGDGCWAVLLFSQSGCLDRLRAVAHQKEIARDGARIGFCQINGINGTTAPLPLCSWWLTRLTLIMALH